MTRVIAYTYEADYHCIGCTKARFDAGGFTKENFLGRPDELDEHGVSMAATDGERNNVNVVFSTDELPCHIPAEAGGYTPVTCGTCHGVIAEAGS